MPQKNNAYYNLTVFFIPWIEFILKIGSHFHLVTFHDLKTSYNDLKVSQAPEGTVRYFDKSLFDKFFLKTQSSLTGPLLRNAYYLLLVQKHIYIHCQYICHRFFTSFGNIVQTFLTCLLAQKVSNFSFNAAKIILIQGIIFFLFYSSFGSFRCGESGARVALGDVTIGCETSCYHR